jgi:hypothetical protein
MQGKITLVSPPDIYENENKSLLFLHLGDADQTAVSQWLSKSNFDQNLNIYVYTDEDDSDWLLYAVARCEYKYIDLDNMNSLTQALSGYLIGKNNFYYKTNQEWLGAVYSKINNNKINSIETFLENALNGVQ